MQTKSFSRISLCVIFVFFFFNTYAQETQQPHTEVTNLIDQKNDFKVNLVLFAGPGMEKINVGRTTEDKDITISGGGGVGLTAVIGYLITTRFETNLGIGFQNCTLSEKVENAEGSFSKTVFSLTAKYIIPVRHNGQINFGGGLGYYIPGDMDIDGSKVPNGAHEITTYDPSIGFHILADYEGFFDLSTNLMSWNVGLQYTAVNFEATAFKRNGISYDASLLKDEFKDLNGSCINLVAGISLYF